MTQAPLDKISSRIFVTPQYRDEDPIVQKPDAIIIANYVIKEKHTYGKTLTLSIRIQKKSHFAKKYVQMYIDRIYEFTTTLAAFKFKTGRVVQPITDTADAIGLGFATCPLTSSYK